MKILLLIALFAVTYAQDSSPDELGANNSSSLAKKNVGYHLKIGVPEAERIKIKEAVNSRIAGGLSSYNGEHPYMAGLLITLTTGQVSICGGTLLNSRRVLTAASCWYDGYSQAYDITVVLGTVYLYSGGTRVHANTITNHPNFDPYSSANDIAVLNTDYVSSSSYIKPLVLPYGSYLTNSFAGQTAEAIGYGRTYDGSAITSSQSLRDVFITVLSNPQCQAYYGGYITSSILCTSGASGKGPCGGDLGGPLILRRYDGTNDMLIGVISFGSASGCQAGHPTAYTRVTSYNTWIRNLL